jgi:hypothetical protein
MLTKEQFIAEQDAKQSVIDTKASLSLHKPGIDVDAEYEKVYDDMYVEYVAENS